MAGNRGTIELSGIMAPQPCGQRKQGSRIINDTSGVIRLEGQEAHLATLAGGEVYNNGRIYADGVDGPDNTSSEHRRNLVQEYCIRITVRYPVPGLIQHLPGIQMNELHFDDVIVGTGLPDEDKITSTSVVWSARAEKDDQRQCRCGYGQKPMMTV